MAQILWENTGRTADEIYFELDSQYAGSDPFSLDAFFLSTVIPALHYGEERYVIDGEICPVLYQGTQEALGWIYHWYYRDHRDPLQLEVATRQSTVENTPTRNTAWFLSGGIDSYATFFENRSLFPEGHPWYIKDGIIAFGFETKEEEQFDYVVNMLKEVAANLGVNLIELYTNVKLIYHEDEKLTGSWFWRYAFQGAVLAAIAHVLGNRIERIIVPSTNSYSNGDHYGTHPLLDPNYSSNNLQVVHDGFRYSRFEKTRMVVENTSQLSHLRVCNNYKTYDADQFNCGKCEKCIRTMLAFLALEKLKNLKAFPESEVTPEMITNYVILKSDYEIEYYQQLIGPLQAVGRDDLTEAIEFVIKRYEKNKVIRKFKNRLINIDQNVFGGNIRQIKRGFRKIWR